MAPISFVFEKFSALTKISGHQKQDSPVEKHFIECYDTAQAHKFEEDWVEKLLTVDATDINKLKP